jgi:hypothetical protein
MPDDRFDFRPRLGRIRDDKARGPRRSRSFVHQVVSATVKANGGPLSPARFRGRRIPAKKDRCSPIGRGQLAVQRLKVSAERRGPGARMRGVIVKARIVRLRSGSRAADAHVRYLQRDGTTRDGERGRLYGPQSDEVDGKDFIDRGREDRHQFRFIVAPEDGEQLADLRSFTRDFMRQMDCIPVLITPSIPHSPEWPAYVAGSEPKPRDSG